MMEKVNWKKAPKGATHFNKNCPSPWLKKGKPNAYWLFDSWHDYSGEAVGDDHIAEAIPRPIKPRKQKKHERMAELLDGVKIMRLTKDKADELRHVFGVNFTAIVVENTAGTGA